MPGRYKGKIVDCDSGAVGANNTPLVKLMFKLGFNDKVLTWTGWFSDKVNQKTGKTYTELVLEKLVQCGFTGKCPSEMAKNKKDINKLFDTEKEWDLDIDYQEDKDGKKTKYFEVKWINNPKKSMKLDENKSVEVFKRMNLAGELARIKKSAPVNVKTVVEAQSKINESEIPF